MRLIPVLTLCSIGFSASALSGCGVLWKKKDGSPGPEAQFSLTGDEQQNFELWKQALVKDCTTDHAFEKRAPEAGQGSLDLGVFLQRTGNSLALKTDGGFVLFGYPQSPVGSGTSSLSRSTTVDGASDNFGAKMTREGARCVVEINGEVVHEAYLFTQIPVIAHTLDTVTQVVPSRHAVKQTDQGLIEHGIVDAWNEARIQADTIKALLQAVFPDWSGEDLAQYFPADRGADAIVPHAVSLGDSGSLPLISSEHPQIPSTLDGWQDFGDHLGALSYDVFLPVQTLKFGDVANSADAGLWRLTVSVGWKSVADGVSEYQLKQVSWGDPVGADPVRAVNCVSARNTAFSGTGIYGKGNFAPSFNGVSGPCRAFADGVFSRALYGSADMRSIVTKKFHGVAGGGDRAQYLGWDIALEDLALEALAAGDDLKTKLDPGGASPLIAQLSLYSQLIAGEAGKFESTKENTQLYVSSLAFSWTFAGLTVTREEGARIIQAIAHVSDPFRISVTSWLTDLAKDPADQKGQIDWALAISEEIKQEVRNLQTKAQEFAMGGLFDSVKLGRVIQDKVDIAAGLNLWRTTLTALSSFQSRDKARVNDFAGLSYKSKFTDLA